MKNQEKEWLLLEKYRGVENDAFYADCARLAAGEPLGYLIGHVPFLNCNIHLDSHPLIPRVETEFWVEQAIKAIKQLIAGQTTHVQVLDLCAGSGAIGIAVGKAIPESIVTLAEIDPVHLPTIQKNIELNIPVNRHIQVTQSDLFAKVNGQFDFILTNPPYIDAAANTVDTNVEAYEPHLALFGGTLGMEIITQIITEAKTHLTTTGQLWIEHEPAQVTAITTLATQHNFMCVTHPDQYGVPRVSVLSMAQ